MTGDGTQAGPDGEDASDVAGTEGASERGQVNGRAGLKQEISNERPPFLVGQRGTG